MKNVVLFVMLLFAMFSIAMAQPAMMTKGTLEKSTQVDNVTIQENRSLSTDRDVLYPEIYGVLNNTHYQHPDAGLFCNAENAFTTTEHYSWYQWETTTDMVSGELSDTIIYCVFYSSGYIKVTVGDDYGNTGSDSIYFDIKDWINPLDNFIMEIDDDLYPTFSGIATPEHRKIKLVHGFVPGEEIYPMVFNLDVGEWVYKDETSHYHQDTLWMYRTILYDTCNHQSHNCIPGLLLSSKQYNDEWFLDMRTILQESDFYQVNYGLNCVYFVYTIDQNGQRHHFVDENGNFVILPSETTEWHIPGEHPDQYYQCGVAEVLEDGSYKLLSLSNKVVNPLIDLTGVKEEVTERSFVVYPNPAQCCFTVEGTGTMTISNVMGQTVLTRQIDGKETISLPRGMYFVKLGNQTRKIVVE